MPSLKTRAFVTALKVHQLVYERSGGLVGHRLLGMPTLLLRTTGRRSGQTRTSALVYAEDAGRRLVCASNGGTPPPAGVAAEPRGRPVGGGAGRPTP